MAYTTKCPKTYGWQDIERKVDDKIIALNILSETIESDSRITEYRLDNCMHMAGTFPYNGGEMSSWLVFMEKQVALTRSIGRIEIVEEGMFTSGVYLPMIYKTDDIAVGEQIEISIGSHKETYMVCGFFNSVMLGSHNCVMTEIVLTEDLYAELENSGYASQASLCSIRLTDVGESLNYEASLKSAVSERYPNILMVSNCYSIVSQSRYISQNLIVGEIADSCINVQVKAEEDFLHEVNADSRVEKIYLNNSLNVSHVGGAELMATLCDDFSRVNNQNTVFEGRFPKYDNEIAIAAKYAKENRFEIGDEIEITASGKQEKYLICGFTQISNNLGRDCLFTRAGYERLGTLTSTSYYINLTSDTDIDAFNLEMKEKFDGDINTTINILTTIEGSAGVYVSLMMIIVIAILVLSWTEPLQPDHQPTRVIVFEQHRCRKMHIYSPYWVYRDCWYRTCIVCLRNGVPALIENKGNCSADFTCR